MCDACDKLAIKKKEKNDAIRGHVHTHIASQSPADVFLKLSMDVALIKKIKGRIFNPHFFMFCFDCTELQCTAIFRKNFVRKALLYLIRINT